MLREEGKKLGIRRARKVAVMDHGGQSIAFNVIVIDHLQWLSLDVIVG